MIDRDLLRADRAQGMTYRQIGEKHGISRSRVYQIIGGDTDKRESCFRGITEKDCIYPNLRKWMNDNKISKIELTRRIFGEGHTELQCRLSEWLRGKCYPTKKNIDRFIKVTGLTYEELFKE